MSPPSPLDVLCGCGCGRMALADALGHHGVGDLKEAGNVGAHDEVALVAVLAGGVVHVVEHAAHELLELAVDLLEGPGEVLGVLGHLQAGDKHAAGVGSLAGHEGDAALLEVLSGLDGGRHVGALAHDLHAVGDEGLGVLEVQGVLAGAGKRDVAGDLPDAAAVLGVPGGTGTLLHVEGEGDALVVAGALLVVDALQDLVVNAVGVLDPALGVGAGQDLAAELGDLLDSVDCNVAGAVDDDVLALEGVALALEVLVHEVDQAVASGLGASQRAAEGEALAGQDAGPLVADALVLAEHVGNLAAADAQVTGGDVGVGADVAAELGHEGLAEVHDLVVGLALGVKVRAALATAHGKGGEGVLENLLEAQELQHAEGDRGVEAQAALVGSNGGVELDAVAAVDLNLALVVDPGHAEHDDALGLDEALQQGRLLILGVGVQRGLDGAENLGRGLEELGLLGVALLELCQDLLGIGHAMLQSLS